MKTVLLMMGILLTTNAFPVDTEQGGCLRKARSLVVRLDNATNRFQTDAVRSTLHEVTLARVSSQNGAIVEEYEAVVTVSYIGSRAFAPGRLYTLRFVRSGCGLASYTLGDLPYDRYPQAPDNGNIADPNDGEGAGAVDGFGT